MPSAIPETPNQKLQDVVAQLSRGVESSEIDGLLAEAAEGLGPKPAASPNRSVIQDFRPIHCSLESELAHLYWQQVGVQAFAGNEVPFVINNDGKLSRAAAELAFANCREVPRHGPIRMLEIGAGSGLFARYFLDTFRDLCRHHQADYFDRLTYYLSDASLRTVEQWDELGQFDDLKDHVVTGVVDATRCSELHTRDGMVVPLSGLACAFAHYVLDVLPAAVVRNGAGGAEQLCVRTYLSDESELQRLCPDWDVDHLRAAAQSDSANTHHELLAVLNLLEFETAFVPMEGDPPPYTEEALSFGRDIPRVLLNFGAFECLERLLAQTEDNGFVLLNDYGPVREAEVPNFGVTTRFGRSIAMGVNFPLLGYLFGKRGIHVATADGDAERSIHSRLLTRGDLPATLARFEEQFCLEVGRRLEAPLAAARNVAALGRVREAFEHFCQALEHERDNWCVLGEVAEFLTANRLPGGIEFSLLALRRNPWYSAWLWNTLGDAFFQKDLLGPAHLAYEKAFSVSPTDVLANYNLSFTFAAMGRSRDALDALATALANDLQGNFRERILHQQQRIVFEISRRWSGDTQRGWQRASAFELPADGRPPR
jgi:tetratricopeptide (TPR) repeat protein